MLINLSRDNSMLVVVSNLQIVVGFHVGPELQVSDENSWTKFALVSFVYQNLKKKQSSVNSGLNIFCCFRLVECIFHNQKMHFYLIYYEQKLYILGLTA